jgi:hypothetical protein
MKRDQRAYLRDYYQKNRETIRQKQRESYEGKYERVSAELLRHLQQHPTHGLSRSEIICPDCERLGPFKAPVCLECGRTGLAQLSIHLRESHKISREVYLEKWVLNRGTSLTSAEFRAKKARPGNLRGGKRFTSVTARRTNIGRTRTLRLEAIENRGSRRSVPEKFQSTLRLWPIASRCLKGRERRQVALELDLWANSINRCCQEMHFPSRPACFWRGEPVSDRQLHDLMRDFNLSEVKVAKLMKLPVHRIRRALAQKRKGKPLQVDVAELVLQLRRHLQQQNHRMNVSKIGGRPSKLKTSEAREIPWKFRVLLKEIATLNAELPISTSPIAIERIGELLCQLAQKKQVSLLLFWARPFLSWLCREYGMSREALSSPAAAARAFLAWEYHVSEETIANLLPRRPEVLTDTKDLKRRELLADIDTAIGSEPRMPTLNLLGRLPKLRPRWKGLTPRALASLLKPLGVMSKEWRVGERVMRGYRRTDLGIFSAEETARELGVSLQGLKQWIRLRKIPVPAVVSRAGVRGRSSVRVWTKGDIQAAKKLISSQPRTIFRVSTRIGGDRGVGVHPTKDRGCNLIRSL